MSTIPASARIAPLESPYEASIAETFARVMPPGMEPLKLFRTMGRNPRVLQRMFAGGLLDKGSIALRERELLILRTCARCGSEYEWGVHVAFFADKVEFSKEQIAATLAARPDTGIWSASEALLIELADQLHDGAAVSDALWTRLAQRYTPEQILELIALAGYYHTISFMTNALRLEPESYAPRFDESLSR